MKSKWIGVVLMLLLTGAALGQGVSVLEVRGGYLNPKDTQAGLIFGGSYGIAVDERVDISLGFDVFHKNYTEQSKIAETVSPGGVVESTVQRELEFNTTLLPIHAAFLIRMPFQPPVYWYFGGGISYQFLFNKEQNFEEGISEKRTYKGLGWLLRAGVEYTIGSRSSLMLEAYYNIGKVKRNEDQTVQGLPVWDEVNVTGLGIRAGLRMEFF